MSLTGIPLIVLAAGLSVVALVATVRTWSRGGRRRRVFTRTVALVCAEVLVVVTVGLIENRNQTFYPSWGDLAGDRTEKVAVVSSPAPDDRRPGAGVVVPAGYAERPQVSFPVIVVLCRSAEVEEVRAAARQLPDVVTVALTPRTATDVDQLVDRLPRLARVAAHGRALVTDRPHRDLAQRLATADPALTTVVTAEHGWGAALAEAADRLPAPLVTPVRP
ncbi:hypothetical protein AB0J80_24035 [Actinoplanes sp. NPDC049548]|uniref:hypothetical protein n=1 Tax=Actinoplanes sp. NPDC049548 TaxID=3155152 RepID=UPI003439C034